MRIIGHRGVAGLTLENTLSSFELAKLLNVEIVELDVRLTKDGQLVVCHDADLGRISPSPHKISGLTYKQLQEIILYDYKSTVPLLWEVLNLMGSHPLVVELKEHGTARALADILADFPKSRVSAASFKVDELAILKQLRPDIKLYGLERTKPFDIIHLARMMKLDGIGLNFWLLNPLTYWYARRRKLDIYVFTVNNRFIGKLLGWLYPDVAICTNHPEWFIKHPHLIHPKSKQSPHIGSPKF